MKKIATIVITLFMSSFGFAQQIGDGYAPGIDNYTIPLQSGGYSGLSALGGIPDTSQQWNHLFVIRHGNANTNYQLQIASTISENDRIFFRKIAIGDLSSVNPTWFELATRGANNFTGNQTFNGNVGIGNTNPLGKLDISGNLILRNYENIRGKGSNITFTAYADDLYGPQIRSFLTFASAVNSTMGLVLSSYSNGYKNELFLLDGKVGIGTFSPDSELTVNGAIHSKEVKVDTNIWPDFVFKKEYNLPTLAQVENHINEKGHLENIPSEEEVLKNGINLGEMNAKLLQKIEELTLYMIEIKKENIQMKNKQSELENIITKLNNNLK